MSTHTQSRRVERRALRFAVSPHWAWLAGGFLLAFAVPFVLADLAGMQRDIFYGVHAIAVVGLFAAWTRATDYDLAAAVRRRWVFTLGLGLFSAAILVFMVLRTESATSRPEGGELIAVFWRGIVYGVTDGLLLSVFPILVVFAAFAGSRVNQRLRGKLAIGAVALGASLAMTAVYHLGYSDFRSEKLRKPVAGDVVWSAPTLLSLNPIGAPIAHAGLHVTAVLHSYETDTFLPPHE